MSDLETCCECDTPTGRAGQGEDSLYAGSFGPYCEDCWSDVPEKLADEIARLTAELAEAKHIIRAFNPPTDSNAYEFLEDGND